MADNILIFEFNKCKKAAFASIYKRYYWGIYYFAKRFVTAEDAADIVADAFFKLYEAKKEFKSTENVKAWLLVNVRNACIDKFRKENSRTAAHKEIIYRLSHEQPDWLDKKEQRERRDTYLKLIYETLEDMPEQKQDIFRMAFIEGLKNPEIAGKLNVSERQIRNTKNRLLSFLRDMFKEKGVAAASFMGYLLF